MDLDALIEACRRLEDSLGDLEPASKEEMLAFTEELVTEEQKFAIAFYRKYSHVLEEMNVRIPPTEEQRKVAVKRVVEMMC